MNAPAPEWRGQMRHFTGLKPPAPEGADLAL